MKNLMTFAVNARAALLSGLYTKEYIVSRTDQMIISTSDPEKLLTDISFCDKAVDLIHILNDYMGHQEIKPDGRAFLTILARRHFSDKITTQEVVEILYRCTRYTILSEEENIAIWVVEGNFEKFTPMLHDEAITELENFLNHYSDTTLPDLF